MAAGPWPNGWSAKVAPVETDETRAQRLAAALQPRPQAEMRSYDPTWRDRARGLAASILGDRAAEGFFGKGLIGDDTGLVDMTPAGFPLALDDIKRSGNLTNLGINTAAALPIPGARKAKEAIQEGIRVFHGSPHDFDKFSMDKIGTGEGAQAYGHGLYFAENEGVARQYRDELSDTTWLVDGQPVEAATTSVNFKNTPEAYAANAMWRFKGDKQAAIEFLSQPGNTRAEKEAAKVIRRAKSIEPSSGRMYEASLNASPDEFLDWDVPFSNQPEHIQEVLKGLGFGNKWTEAGSSGREAYRRIAFKKAVPGSGKSHDDTAAAEALRAAGIKGIRYKDAGSRGKGEGTSNFVVFDPEIIEILRKYGIAGLVGGGAAAASVAGSGTAEASEKERLVNTLSR
jgi:hypothetical protein